MVSFRPTPAQAAGRGAVVGTLAGLAPFLVGLAAWAERGWDDPERGWLALVPALLTVLIGATVTVAFGRRDGADIDDRGIHPASGPTRTPGGEPAFTSWRRIRDLSCERRHGRTQIVAYLDTG